MFAGLNAQPHQLPLHNDWRNRYVSEPVFLDPSKTLSWHPLVNDSLFYFFLKDTIDSPSVNLAYSKWINERWATPEKFRFRVRPLIDLESGYSTGRENFVTHHAGGGLEITGSFKSKIAFQISGIGAKAKFPEYLSAFADSTENFPGYGYAWEGEDGQFSTNVFNGYLSYKPSRFFTFTAGKGKRFAGNGYRSLLLSDFSYSYPYLEIRTNVWRVEYINLFAALKDISLAGGRLADADNKYAAIHMLNVNITNNVSVSFFESIIWQGRDNLSKRGFDVNYLNPVIFYRPVEFAQGSADNAIMGLNLSIRTESPFRFYLQAVIDEFLLSEFRAHRGWWGNKYGGQLGMAVENFGARNSFSILAEFNIVRPFTFTHGSVKQNYGQFNLPLAHPLGNNFQEGVLIGRYTRNKWMVENKVVVAEFGRDFPDSLNLGGDIFRSYIGPGLTYGNVVGQGISHFLLHNELRINYLLDAANFLRVHAGYIYRRMDQEGAISQSHTLQLGISTLLWNRYRDF